MKRLLVLQVLSTKFLHYSNFTAHTASADQNICEALRNTPLLLSLMVAMLTLHFNLQGIYSNTVSHS